MKTRKEYMIIAGNEVEKVESLVTKLLNDGAELQGGLTISMIHAGDGPFIVYGQGVVRTFFDDRPEINIISKGG